MAGQQPTSDMRQRARVDLSPDVSVLLDQAASLFGLSRAETLRRIVRASLDVGPALSAENTKVVAALASQVRMVGRNLSQLLHAVHGGRAVSLAGALPVFEALDRRIRDIDGELTAMTVAHGLKLRRAAHLPDLEP